MFCVTLLQHVARVQNIFQQAVVNDDNIKMREFDSMCIFQKYAISFRIRLAEH